MSGQKDSEVWDVVVVGAGAAGLMCAVHAARGGARVVVVERAEKIAKKIRISGGGRCNFSNLDVRAENYLSNNPHFCRSALARYTPAHFIEWLQSENIAFHEKTLGQLFCDDSAQNIVDLFQRELRSLKVLVRCNEELEEILPIPADTKDLTEPHTADVMPGTKASTQMRYLLRSRDHRYIARSVVIASGGLSIPKMGASGYGMDVARSFGISVVAPRPGLVPLIVAPAWRPMCAALAGLSIEAVVSLGETSFRENILFTHRGLSGPAILQISSYWKAGNSIHIDLLPDLAVREILEEHSRSSMELKTLLSQWMPRRLAEAWCEQGPGSPVLKHLVARDRDHIAELLHAWEVPISGTEGFEKAEVTVGGVDTRQISSKTMEANKQPGLYFIGEVLDVCGWLGGYNFQWAWASGVAAARAIVEDLQPQGNDK